MPIQYNPYVPGVGRLDDAQLLLRSMPYADPGGWDYGPQTRGQGVVFSDENTSFGLSNEGPGPLGKMLGTGTQMLAGAFPDQFGWLMQRGATGAMEPVFNTQFRWDNRGTTLFQNALIAQQAAASGAMGAGGATTKGSSEAWRGIGSAFGADDPNMPAVRTFLSVLGGVGDPVQAARSLMGYDSGTAARMFSGSHGVRVMSGLNALRGGGAGAGAAGLMDPFGDDFTMMRAATAYNATDLVNRTMYGTFDANGMYAGQGIEKSADVNGASERLVGEIVSRSLQDNATLFMRDMNAVDENGRPRMTVAGRLGELFNERNRLLEARNLGDRVARDYGDGSDIAGIIGRSAAGQDVSDEERGKLPEYAREILDELKGSGMTLKDVGSRLEKVETSIHEGTRDLVKSVTSTVDSMRDLFGSESAAASALDRITGGAGFTSSEVAQRVRDRIDDMKILGMNAGMAPEQVGAVLGSVIGSVESGRTGIAAGTGFTGQMALEMGNLFMETMPTGSRKRQQDVANAYSEYARSNASSRSFGASTILAAMRDSGAVDDDTYQRLRDQLSSGDPHRFNEAVRNMAAMRGMSERDFMSMITDKVVVDSVGAGMSQEAQADAARINADAMRGEMSRLYTVGRGRAERTKSVGMATSLGIGRNEVSAAEESGRYNAMAQLLTEGGRKDDADELRAQLGENLRKYGDRDAAVRATMEWANRRGIIDQLGPEAASRVSRAGTDAVNALVSREAVSTAGEDSLTRLVSGDGGNGVRTVMAGGLGQLANEIERMSGSGELWDAGGKRIDASSDISKIRDMLSSGDVSGAEKAINSLYSLLGGRTRNRLQAGLRNITLMTPEQIRKIQNEHDLIAEALEDKETAGFFNGVTSPEARKVLAEQARRLREAKAAGADPETMARLRAQLREKQNELRDSGKGDRERLVAAVAKGDLGALVDVFRNGNIPKEVFQQALQQAGLSLDGIEGLTMSTDAELLSADMRGAGTFDERMDILTGAASNLSAVDMAGLGDEGLSAYASVLAGSDGAAEVFLGKTRDVGGLEGGKSYSDLVDIVNNRGVDVSPDGKKRYVRGRYTAEQRKAAEIARLSLEEEELARRIDATRESINGGGLTEDERNKEESNLRRLEEQHAKVSSRKKAVDEMGAEKYALAVDRARESRGAGSDGSVRVNLDEITRVLKLIADKVGVMAGELQAEVTW